MIKNGRMFLYSPSFLRKATASYVIQRVAMSRQILLITGLKSILNSLVLASLRHIRETKRFIAF